MEPLPAITGRGEEGRVLARNEGRGWALFGKPNQARKSGGQIPDGPPLADFAPTVVLKAKDFTADFMIHNVRSHPIGSEPKIATELGSNNPAVTATVNDNSGNRFT